MQLKQTNKFVSLASICLMKSCVKISCQHDRIHWVFPVLVVINMTECTFIKSHTVSKCNVHMQLKQTNKFVSLASICLMKSCVKISCQHDRIHWVLVLVVINMTECTFISQLFTWSMLILIPLWQVKLLDA